MIFAQHSNDDWREINEIIARAANSSMKNIISYETEPKVSIDFNHEPYSANFAPDQTKVIQDRLVRVLVWYDNEWGFSCRMVDNALLMGSL